MGVDAQMFVRTKRTLTPDQVRHEAVRLVTAFGTDVLFVSRPERRTDNKIERAGRHALNIIKEYTQDGPRIRPKPGETFVEVSLCGRFYGPGYERGNLVDILSIARWLRTAFAPCEIWYGGDSSGINAQVLDAAYEKELWEHFCGENGRAYFEMRGLARHDGVHCDFCNVDVVSNGSGPGYSIHTCNGCDGVFRRASDTGVVTIDDGDGFNRRVDMLSRDAARMALLDATCALELDMAEVVSAQREAGIVTVAVRSRWVDMNGIERVQLYERAGTMMMEHANRAEKEQGFK